ALSHADAAAPASASRVRTQALLAVAGTLGVIVPPSIVLLLLGDAMLRAHAEGLNLARDLATPIAQASLRVINTQDVLQAALLPGALLLAGWAAIAALQARAASPAEGIGAESPRQRWALRIVPWLWLALVALVASGRVRAVEGAAAAGVALLAWC